MSLQCEEQGVYGIVVIHYYTIKINVYGSMIQANVDHLWIDLPQYCNTVL